MSSFNLFKVCILTIKHGQLSYERCFRALCLKGILQILSLIIEKEPGVSLTYPDFSWIKFLIGKGLEPFWNCQFDWQKKKGPPPNIIYHQPNYQTSCKIQQFTSHTNMSFVYLWIWEEANLHAGSSKERGEVTMIHFGSM